MNTDLKKSGYVLPVLLWLFLLLTTFSQLSTAQIPEKAEFGKFAITGATVHTVTNGVIENGTVMIDGERISYVGGSTQTPTGYEEIDASGKHIYPGFMDAFTRLGLIEISTLDITIDHAELGEFNPHIRSFTGFNPSSVNIPVTRLNGITHVITAPASGRIAGKGMVADLYGYSPDSMSVKGNAALYMNWPTSVKRGWWDDRKPDKIKEEYENNIDELNKFWDRAVFYNRMMRAYELDPQNKAKPDKDKKMIAMREVVTGEIPVVLSVSKEQDILNALEWAKQHDQARFIFAGVQEGWRVAGEIADAGIPCIVSTLYTPRRDYDNYQRPYQNPGMLHEAGVTVMFATWEVENVRNLPYHAGYGAAYGLGKEEALKAVTINPAVAFGVADRLGSIEEGKQANLFIADGDPFEPMNHVEQVFIRGNKIPMVSRHTQLYEEYLNRGAVEN